MRFVATRDFSNNCGLEIKNALHPNHVHKGAVFSIGLDLPFELLTPSEQKLVSDLRNAECICNADDAERVKMIRDEVATEKQRLRRTNTERWTRAHKLQVTAMIIAVILALIGWFVFGRSTRQLHSTPTVVPPSGGHP